MNITFPIVLELLCTFAIWSYLYKENPLYRLFENIFIGIAVGHILVMSIDAINKSAVTPLLKGSYIYGLPILLGLSLYFYFSKNYFYIYRLPMAVFVGTGLGIGVRGLVHGTIVTQLGAIVTAASGKDLLTNVNGLISIIGTILVLYYFVFTFFLERRGGLGMMSKMGIYVMMLAFGAAFANVAMTRTSYLAGRLIFLWLTDAKYLMPVVAIAFILVVLLGTYLERRKKLPK